MDASLEEQLQITKQTYTNPELARAYLEEHGKHPKEFDLMERFAKTINGEKILDIGCGPGQNAYKLHDLGFLVTGIDYSPAMVELAKTWQEKSPRPEFLIGDVRELNHYFASNSFDAAICMAVLLHIPKYEIPLIFRTMHAVVKPHGKVLVSISSSPQEQFLLENALSGKKFKRIYFYWQREKFAQELEKAGFSITDISESPGGLVNGKPTTWIRYQAEVIK